MSSSSGPTTTTSYWCHQCNRFVRVWAGDAVACSACGGGFLENRPNRHPETRLRRSRRALSGDRSPFNPVIVLRSPSNGRSRAENSFDLYYDDGVGSGLRPLPSGMSEFLMGSGFERLLEQVSHIGGAANRAAGIVGGGCDHPPASKSAVDSMPTVMITSRHVKLDSHCVVCMELFEVGAEVREMPCKHIYHQECIVPWLSMRNSCPVCRHEMPGDDEMAPSGAAEEEEEDPVGLTIWRLPGGGFAVGRFSGERELPVVYTEMDGGGLNAEGGGGGAPRRISWSNGGNRSRAVGGGIVGAFRNLFSCFGPSSTRHHSRPSSSRRNNRGTTTTRRSLNG